MSGEELKIKLQEGGHQITEIAEKLNLSQPNVSRYLAVADVKSGFLEKLCIALKRDMTFFYGGTEYLPEVNTVDNNQTVPKYLYEELKKEIYEYRDTIKDLQHQISLMQKGLTIPEIAQKEVG